MKFASKFYFFALLSMLAIAQSCKSSDDDEEEVETNDYGEQSITDDAAILAFLNSHTFNYEDFENPTSGQVTITIDTLAGASANKRPLREFVSSLEVPLTDQEEVVTNHTLYYLVARQGIRTQNNPTIADSVYVSYTGKLLNGTVFDTTTYPIWFDTAGIVRGFRQGIQFFSPGTYQQESDGSITFENFAKGLIIMPSTLGYFASVRSTIPAYSPLIFDINLYTTNPSDHDGDGILSIQEDPDGDGNPYNDDTDDNGIANMFDPDDDGDGVLTIDEYDVDNDGVPDDEDNDGIPDYLDAD